MKELQATCKVPLLIVITEVQVFNHKVNVQLVIKMLHRMIESVDKMRLKKKERIEEIKVTIWMLLPIMIKCNEMMIKI